MKRTSWKFKVLLFWAIKVCKIPFTVNFTPPDSEDFYGIGFAANEQAATRMRGDDFLLERVRAADAMIAALKGTRKSRRMLNSAAKKAAHQIAPEPDFYKPEEPQQ